MMLLHNLYLKMSMKVEQWTYNISGLLFTFPSVLLFGLQNINDTN